MADSEKVRKGLECCQPLEDAAPYNCKECPYNEVSLYTDECQKKLHQDALELLKEQEPMIPVFLPIRDRYIVTKQCNYRCANCGELICRSDLFCEHCGRPVKWDDKQS